MRLDRLLARAGVASRRRAKALVAEGRVTVNGALVESPGQPVDPASDEIRVDGRCLRDFPPSLYLALHKPRGYLSTVSDDRNRPTVMHLIPPRLGRIYPVGRLDLSSEGLLLLTNDGPLTHRLIHPRYHVAKTYLVWIRGHLSPTSLQTLRQGVPLEEGLTAPATIRILRRTRHGMQLKFVLHEGRKRQIRRMCHAVGHEVTRLLRIQFGPIPLGDLSPGTWRFLTREEIQALYRCAGLRRRSESVSRDEDGKRVLRDED